MSRSNMPQPAQGVYRRSDSTNWQWRIKVPQDLKHLYDNKLWAGGCSLRTSDLREANRLAADLRSQWLNKFSEQRTSLTPRKLDRLTPELARFLAQTALHGILDSNMEFRCTPGDQERLLGWMRSMGMPGAQAAQDLISWTASTGSAFVDPLGGMSDPMAAMVMVQAGDEMTGPMLDALNAMMLDMLAAIARKDYTDRRRRQQQGIEKVKAAGGYKGRKEDTKRNDAIMVMLDKGQSWNSIVAATGSSRSTLSRLSRRLKEAAPAV